MENWVRNNGLAITFVYCTLVTISIVWAGYHTPIELRGGCLNKFDAIGSDVEDLREVVRGRFNELKMRMNVIDGLDP